MPVWNFDAFMNDVVNGTRGVSGYRRHRGDMLRRHNATTVLLLALSIALPRGAHPHVLVKEGFRLVKQSSNGGKLTSGGSNQGASYYSGGDCSSIKYVDTCSDVEGARFYERDGLDGVYVVDGDAVTKCSRYRSEWRCNQCNFGRCTSTSGATATRTGSTGD